MNTIKEINEKKIAELVALKHQIDAEIVMLQRGIVLGSVVSVPMWREHLDDTVDSLNDTQELEVA